MLGKFKKPSVSESDWLPEDADVFNSDSEWLSALEAWKSLLKAEGVGWVSSNISMLWA